MELRQLRYFVTLAEHLHFAKAAEALDLAPSALSMQLQALERELGVKLVQRTKRSVALTSAGQLFLQEARASLFQIKRTEMIARQAGRGEIGSLEIGYVISAACAGIVQQILSAYRKDVPGIQIGLHELESPLQLQRLDEGKLDACIVRTIVGHAESFEVMPLLHEDVVVALPKDHPLAKQAEVRAEDLRNEAFITPQFQRDFGFTQPLFAIGEKAGFSPQITQPTRDFITTLALVGGGFGVATVPHSISHLQMPGIIYKPLVDVTEKSTLTLVFRRNDKSPAVLRLKQIASQLTLPSKHVK
ncbi:LysR substrate-binding domain-containing protein [Leeia oryzae]|uniref:LysR substrate-binding domain-containing protein n=1 Tax=Leeia oryzae TaxID=356662 RepID=UPI00037171B8|nr:LysR substrate-binding domain-containing protein [Leeia oryzae]